MTFDSQVSAIRVDDQDFLVSSTIERCPKVMMLRELFKNALEAAEDAPEGGSVEFSVTEIGDVPKLTIWNNGPGMDEEELARMTNHPQGEGPRQELRDGREGCLASIEPSGFTLPVVQGRPRP